MTKLKTLSTEFTSRDYVHRKFESQAISNEVVSFSSPKFGVLILYGFEKCVRENIAIFATKEYQIFCMNVYFRS